MTDCRAQAPASTDYCDKTVGGYNTTVLMVADPGDFTGSAEAKYYIANLEVSRLTSQIICPVTDHKPHVRTE